MPLNANSQQKMLRGADTIWAAFPVWGAKAHAPNGHTLTVWVKRAQALQFKDIYIEVLIPKVGGYLGIIVSTSLFKYHQLALCFFLEFLLRDSRDRWYYSDLFDASVFLFC